MERRVLTGKFSKLILFGDDFGLQQLIHIIPPRLISGIVAASIRPQYLDSIKIISRKVGCKLFVQPQYNTEEYQQFLSGLRGLNSDMIFCNSYSMLIRSDVLNMVNYNAINIHWSLLSQNRGPNPTQWAIIKGDKKTGISIHYMDDGLDSGDIIAQTEEVILETDTWVTVNERLKIKSSDFLKIHMPDIIAGTNKRSKQSEKNISVNNRLTPDYPKIDFERMSDRQIFNLVRAQVSPLKGAFMDRKGGRIYFDKYLNENEIAQLRRKYAE